MSSTSWIQVAGTVFVGLAGLWLAHNYRRQVRLKLADRQADSYLSLWKLTAVATPERTAPLDKVECHELRDRMNRWYHDVDANRFQRHPYYATCAILLSISDSNSDGDRYPSAFCIRLRL
jgi:hypothetical protein